MMKKAMVNYWVDMVTGVAFLACALTGLLRMFPELTVSVSSAGEPVIFGISTAIWQTVHDWSGLIMAAGVGVHTALHFRWLVSMTGKIARGKGAGAASSARRGRRAAALRPAAQTGAAGAVWAAERSDKAAQALSRLAEMSSGGVTGDASTRNGSAASAGDEDARAAVPGRDRGRLYSRKWFLVTAGAAGITAFAAGFGLLSGGAESPSSGTTTGTSGGGQWGRKNSWDNGEDDTSTGGSDSATGSTSQRVVVDDQSCTGCGNCLHQCRYGVFTLNGGKALVQNAGACTLCGHCVRACAPGAITLNA